MKKTLPLVIALSLLLAACVQASPRAPASTLPVGETSTTKTSDQTPGPENPAVLTVLVHDSFAVSAELVQAFEEENKVTVHFVKGGDAGATLNRAILSAAAGTPAGDVLYGVDNTFLSRALQQELFEPYNAPALAKVPDSFKLDPANRALPINYGDVCINYDVQYFQEHELPLPENLVQLIDPTFMGMLVVENPVTSSPGLSFMLATIAEQGEDLWLEWWGAMKENGLTIAPDWETAYYTNFSGSSGRGAYPMVVSYASSPVAEVIYSDPRVTDAPTASLVFDNACWRQIEFAGILKGTKQPELARKFIDFLLSPEFQADVPLQMFVYPVLDGVQLPEDFINYSQIPKNPASLDPARIAENRDAWIKAWSDLMLK